MWRAMAPFGVEGAPLQGLMEPEKDGVRGIQKPRDVT